MPIFMRRALILLLACLPGLAAASGWSGLVYRSPAGFSVSYPMAWWRVDDNVATLTLISGGAGAEAGILSPGEAGIRVFAAGAGDAAYQRARNGVTPPGTRIVQRKLLYLPRAAWAGCTRPAMVQLEDTASAPQDATRTTYFTCATNGAALSLALVQWSADRHQAAPFQTALRMLETLRPD